MAWSCCGPIRFSPGCWASRPQLWPAVLAEDPGSGLPTGEREELLAAAVRSRECGLPLRRACRVCLGGGRELCLSLHMSWVEQPDGSWLAYIACADISQEAAAQAEHQIRSRMYDLLLEHTSLLTLDYDPARDLAQIQRHSTSGRRTSRTVSGYLKSLLTASYLHPEDRRRLAGAVPSGHHASQDGLLHLSGGL